MSLEVSQQGWPRRRHWTLWAALAAGLLLRLWFVWRVGHVSEDSLLYGDLAQNLLKHGVYGLTDMANGMPIQRPTLIRLPGYPLFLALCFRIFGLGKFGAVMLVQVAMDLWTCLLLAGIARRVFNERAATIALWMGALCPFMANYAASALTEAPTLFCMALAFYALARWQQSRENKWLAAIGFALAWAILLRPEQAMLAAAVIPAVLWLSRKTPRRSLKPALILSLLTILPLVPWTIRNYHTMHVFQPLAPRYANDPGEMNPYGFQRWFRTWAIDFASTDQVYWPFDGQPISIADLPNRAFDSNDQYAATDALLADYNETTTPTPALDARFAAIAGDRIAADPLRYYVALPIARVANMILRPRTDSLPVQLDWWRFRQHPAETIVACAYGLLNLAYLTLAAIAFRRRRAWGPWAPLLWAMVATIVMRTLLLLNMDNSEPRYTLEFYPTLIILASGVVAAWWTRNASGKPSP